jgi:hypothetical protein
LAAKKGATRFSILVFQNAPCRLWAGIAANVQVYVCRFNATYTMLYCAVGFLSEGSVKLLKKKKKRGALAS